MNKFEIKLQEIYQENCLDVFKIIKDKSIDIVVTSPPYNFNVKYSTYKDNLAFPEYLNFLKTVTAEIKRTLKPNGSFFINIGNSPSSPDNTYILYSVFREFFTCQNDINWIKSISIEDKSYGHYKPINSDRFLNHLHEKVWHFTHEGNVKIDRKAIGVPYVHKSNVSRWKSKQITNNNENDLRCAGNNWFIPYETILNKTDKGNHPAIFPVKLVENCIKLHGYNENTVVLDPFLGSGTTLVACQKFNIKGLGCEIDNDYIQFAINRLNNS